MADPGVYCGIDLIGGGTGAIDKINGSVLSDKDIFCTVKAGKFYSHWLDDDSGAGESSPAIISPDLNAGTKRWLLAEGVFAGLTLYGNIVIPNNGYIGSVSDTDAIQIEADGDVVLTQGLAITNNLTMTGNIVIPDDGTIGQAAGPLLTFDDTGNVLLITGCVGGVKLATAGTDTQTVMFLTGYNDQTAYTPEFQICKSHDDSFETLTPTIDTEVLGTIRFRGVDSGSAWDDGALITAVQSGAAGAKVPTKLVLSVYSSTALNTNQLVLHNSGGIFMATLKSGANQGAAGAAANELWQDTTDQSIKIGV